MVCIADGAAGLLDKLVLLQDHAFVEKVLKVQESSLDGLLYVSLVVYDVAFKLLPIGRSSCREHLLLCKLGFKKALSGHLLLLEGTLLDDEEEESDMQHCKFAFVA